MFQFPYVEWTTISIGPLTLQVWGMFVALGIGWSLYIISKRAAHVGMNTDTLLDLAFWVVVAGFIGARLGHVFLYEPAYFVHAPLEIVAIWRGGLSSFGGFVGAMIGFVAYTRKKKISKQAVLTMADQLAFASVFGWMTARVGCAMIHDHWGVPCNCPFAVQTPSGPRLDMAILEIIALLPLAILFFLWRNTQKPVGFFLGILATYYGVLRFILDFFRATDIASADVRYLGLTPGQYLAIVFFVWGIWLLQRQRSK